MKISGAKKSFMGQDFHFHAWNIISMYGNVISCIENFMFSCMHFSCHDFFMHEHFLPRFSMHGIFRTGTVVVNEAGMG